MQKCVLCAANTSTGHLFSGTIDSWFWQLIHQSLNLAEFSKNTKFIVIKFLFCIDRQTIWDEIHQTLLSKFSLLVEFLTVKMIVKN